MKVPTQSELVAHSKNEEIIIGVGPRFFQSVIFSTLTILLCTTQKRDCMTLSPSSEIRRVVAMQEEPHTSWKTKYLKEPCSGTIINNIKP